MTNVMAALPNISDALCSTPQSLADAYYATKTRTRLEFAGVPQTTEPVSAVSRPKFTILWGHVGEVLLFNHFSDCRYMAQLRIYLPRSCALIPRWRLLWQFLRPVFSASRMQYISVLHS